MYETLVKPRNRITDYLTQFSGITKELLVDVDVRLEDVQKSIRALLPPDAILVGQSLNFDLIALKVMCMVRLQHVLLLLFKYKFHMRTAEYCLHLNNQLHMN